MVWLTCLAQHLLNLKLCLLSSHRAVAVSASGDHANSEMLHCNIRMCPMSHVRCGIKQPSESVLRANGMFLRLQLVRISISRHAIAGKTQFHTAVEDWQLQPYLLPAAPALSEIPAKVHDDPEETSSCPVCGW